MISRLKPRLVAGVRNFSQSQA